MSEFIFIPLWVLFFTMISELPMFQERMWVLSKERTRNTFLFAFAAFLPIIWFAGHRGYIGDTGAYIEAFNAMPEHASELNDYFDTITKDPGYYVLASLFKVFINSDPTTWFSFLAFMQGLILVITFRKYSSKYMTSVFLFVASADYISWMYNGVRQFTAVTLIFLGTGFFIEKKYIQSIGIILIAALFHQSALLMIPFMIISQGKAFNKKTYIYILLVILAIVFVDQFTDFLNDSLATTQYKNVINDYQNFNDNGTNPIRVLVYSIPTILSFLGRAQINDYYDPLIHFCVNASLISTGLYLVSMVTSGVYIGRLPIYVSLYGYILLPWLIDNIFEYHTGKIINRVMFMFYLVFYFYQMHISWHMF